jgi:hypothetical protein
MLELTIPQFVGYNGASAPKIIYREKEPKADPPGDFVVVLAIFIWGVISPERKMILPK